MIAVNREQPRPSPAYEIVNLSRGSGASLGEIVATDCGFLKAVPRVSEINSHVAHHMLVTTIVTSRYNGDYCEWKLGIRLLETRLEGIQPLDLNKRSKRVHSPVKLTHSPMTGKIFTDFPHTIFFDR